jgi:type IV secretory pathway TrbL component
MATDTDVYAKAIAAAEAASAALSARYSVDRPTPSVGSHCSHVAVTILR